MVDGRHGREGNSRNPQQSFEESDARTVPTCKKSANSRVTPEESMEGRRAANGKLALNLFIGTPCGAVDAERLTGACRCL